MNGEDLHRRIGHLRSDAKVSSKLALLWRSKPEATSVTGAECARRAKDPQRRLEPLRRRSETRAITGEECARNARDPRRRLEPLRQHGREMPVSPIARVQSNTH